ncbi:hypothetical protein SVAN01_06535 [Stagonosporopsis vannaccii]|nr:hypothetical protein SVAN01_06535 [Stagonosporopsis vannaccii]
MLYNQRVKNFVNIIIVTLDYDIELVRRLLLSISHAAACDNDVREAHPGPTGAQLAAAFSPQIVHPDLAQASLDNDTRAAGLNTAGE